MLHALPEGFPTPEARDGKGLAKALGDAAARWMRGEYAEALARLHASIVIAATERATNARIDRLERVVTQLDAWLAAREQSPEAPPPSLNESVMISVEVPERPATERRASAPETMTLESRDLQEVDPPRASAPPVWPPIAAAVAPIARRPLSTTLEEVSRPSVPTPVVEVPARAEPRKNPLGTTLPEGAIPAELRASIEASVKRTAAARSDPFAGLDQPATPSAVDARAPQSSQSSQASQAPQAPARSIPDGTPITLASGALEDAKSDDEEKPRSSVSTQRFVPPTTRRPNEGEVYPPILPSEDDDRSGRGGGTK